MEGIANFVSFLGGVKLLLENWEICKQTFTNFKKASEKLGEHFLNVINHASSKGRKFHQSVVEKAVAFTTVMNIQSRG